jgi:hypothetical protein
VPAVKGFDGADVLLAEDRRVQVDDVIAATGFRPALEPVLGHLGVLSESGCPKVQGGATMPGCPDLYFVGMREQLAGLLRVIGKEARAVAKAIGRSVPRPG